MEDDTNLDGAWNAFAKDLTDKGVKHKDIKPIRQAFKNGASGMLVKRLHGDDVLIDLYNNKPMAFALMQRLGEICRGAYPKGEWNELHDAAVIAGGFAVLTLSVPCGWSVKQIGDAIRNFTV